MIEALSWAVFEYCWNELNNLVNNRSEKIHALFAFKFCKQLSINLTRIRLSVEARHNNVCNCFSASFKIFSRFWWFIVKGVGLLTWTGSTTPKTSSSSAFTDGSREKFSSSILEFDIRRSQRNVCPLEQMLSRSRRVKESSSESFRFCDGTSSSSFYLFFILLLNNITGAT